MGRTGHDAEPDLALTAVAHNAEGAPGLGSQAFDVALAWGTSVALLGLAMAQQPGRIIPETKLEVSLDPLRYLGRALSAWDPSAGFGRVQNQAVGYLFPMGPFSALGQAIGLPAWVTQRLWIGAILVVGFLGARALARALGMAGPAGPTVAGLAYTLSPASMATVAFQSAGQLPFALAPWVLVPLVSRGEDSPRRRAARSALAVALMGGVNGAATLAVLPLVGCWFLTRAPSPARRRLAGWWALGAAAATLWWFIALAVSVRYGVRFTLFTEQSVITTSTETATDLWRGTGNWLGQLDTRQGRWLPGAWLMVSNPFAVVCSTLAAAGGALGLTRRDAPGRAWLLPAALAGAAIAGVGYAGAGGGPLAGTVQGLLDGPLVVFRNVHKFSALIRLPLAIGLGHLVATALSRPAVETPGPPAPVRPARFDQRSPAASSEPKPRPVWTALAAPLLAVGLVVGAAFPLVSGELAAPGSFAELPTAWREAAAWVDRQADSSRTLLLPGAGFAETTWGRPLDEPWAVLADGSWAVRDLIPLGGGGSTRLLDGLDDALAGDYLPAGFSEALRRAGVGHLVVRNDLDLTRSGGPSATSMRRLLDTGFGLERVAAFGPALAPAQTAGNALDPTVDDHRVSADPNDLDRTTLRQIEVYAVKSPAGRATTYPLEGALAIGGGPEALVTMPTALVEGRATFLADDVPAEAVAAGGLIRASTDTARRRDVDSGSIRDANTATLTADEQSPWAGRTPVDRWPDDDRAPSSLTVARDGPGIVLTADPGAVGTPAANQAQAAFDLDPATVWAPTPDPDGRWLELAFDSARVVDHADLVIPSSAARRVGAVEIATDGGTTTTEFDSEGRASIELPSEPTRRVRITITSVLQGPVVTPVGLAEITLAGVDLDRTIVAASPGGPTDVAVVSRERRDRYDLAGTDEEPTLDRVVDLADGSWSISGTAEAQPGPALDRILAAATPPASADSITVEGTGPLDGRPELAPAMALDDDPTTAWVTDPAVEAPSLELSWDRPVTVEQITITALASGTAPIDQVTVAIGGGTVVRPLAGSGTFKIPPTRTDRLTITFDGLRREDQQVGIAEVAVDGLAGRTAPVPDRAALVDLSCGQGPNLAVDGQATRTRATTTVGALLGAEPILWSTCEPADLSGEVRLADAHADTGALRIDSMVAERAGAVSKVDAARAVKILGWGATSRRVSVAAGGGGILATTENTNDGWEATLAGTTLKPVRVDGWRQGWILPAGAAGTVMLAYSPNRPHRAGLGLGAMGLLALLAGSVLPGRRTRSTRLPTERPLPTWLLVGLGAGVGLALGGWTVLALPVLVAIPRREDKLPAVMVAGIIGAGVVVVSAGPGAGPGAGAFSFTAQLLATVGWVALAVAAFPKGWRFRLSTDRPGGADGLDHAGAR